MFGVGISDVGAALGSLNFIGSAARQRGDFGSALVFLALVGSARLFLVILSVGKPAQKGFLSGPWVGDEQRSKVLHPPYLKLNGPAAKLQ